MSVKEPAFANQLSKRRDLERQREIHLAKIAAAKPMLTTQTDLPHGYRFPLLKAKKVMQEEGIHATAC
jgi:hypothetical protein